MFFFKRAVMVSVYGVMLCLISGCSTSNITNTKRSAVERLILSTAADRSIVQLDEDVFKDKKVYVDFSYLDCTDVAYVKGYVRQKIGSYGALLIDDKKASDFTVEVFSGSLETDFDSFLLGVPPVPVPIPFAGTVIETPEIAFFKRDAQAATCKLGFSVVETKTGALLHSQHNLIGAAFYNRYNIIGIFTWSATDVPKLKNRFLYNSESE